MADIIIEPKSLDFYPRTLVIPYKKQKAAGLCPLESWSSSSFMTHLQKSAACPCQYSMAVYVTDGLRGGRNVLSWELVS